MSAEKKAPEPELKFSKACREGHHSTCGGQRFIRLGKDGRGEYARCRCSCHG